MKTEVGWLPSLVKHQLHQQGGGQGGANQGLAYIRVSDDTLMWMNGQGFDRDDLRRAKFIITRIEEYIQGTTNPYIQVMELIGRKKSANNSFDHLVMDVCKWDKCCALNKVTNMTNWFTTMIIVVNQDEVKVRKKLFLEKDLKLVTAKAIFKQGGKAAKTSPMLEASHTSGEGGASQAQAGESAAGVSLYQSSHGRRQQHGCGAPRRGRGGFQ
jgi:hypothetical protein